MTCDQCESYKRALAELTFQVMQLEPANRELKREIEELKKEQSATIRAIIVSLTKDKE